MYLSAELMAVADQAITETFEQTSIVWQAIPHWVTGDPAQTRVPADDVNAASATVLTIVPDSKPFDVTLASAVCASPDSLINIIKDRTAKLAAKVDTDVLAALRTKSAPNNKPFNDTGPDTILDSLIDARAFVENEGFRAPSCLIANTGAHKALNKLVDGYSILEPILTGASINSLHRVDQIENLAPAKPQVMLLGRRQLIPHGSAPEASPGEEPIDLAVSVPPSLEVVGENGDNKIALSVRIGYALRVKDVGGVVTLTKP